MRMWMIDPTLLCDRHLLAEHGEIHKHKPSFEKKHRVDGRIVPVVQIEPEAMGRRHEELVVEMGRRGMRHNSPYQMPDLSYLHPHHRHARVNWLKSITDLCSRCAECRKRIRGRIVGEGR